MLMANGATEVHALVSHGVFSDPALDKITNSCLGEFIGGLATAAKIDTHATM